MAEAQISKGNRIEGTAKRKASSPVKWKDIKSETTEELQRRQEMEWKLARNEESATENKPLQTFGENSGLQSDLENSYNSGLGYESASTPSKEVSEKGLSEAEQEACVKYLAEHGGTKRGDKGENMYPCNTCEQLFAGWRQLRRHLNVHSDFKPYKCPTCPMAFHQPHKLKRHLDTHTGEKKYSCDICDKKVSRPEHLRRHMLTHSEEKAFKCLHCDHCARRADSIRSHCRVKHPGLEAMYICTNEDYITKKTPKKKDGDAEDGSDSGKKGDTLKVKINASGKKSHKRKLVPSIDGLDVVDVPKQKKKKSKKSVTEASLTTLGGVPPTKENALISLGLSKRVPSPEAEFAPIQALTGPETMHESYESKAGQGDLRCDGKSTIENENSNRNVGNDEGASAGDRSMSGNPNSPAWLQPNENWFQNNKDNNLKSDIAKSLPRLKDQMEAQKYQSTEQPYTSAQSFQQSSWQNSKDMGVEMKQKSPVVSFPNLIDRTMPPVWSASLMSQQHHLLPTTDKLPHSWPPMQPHHFESHLPSDRTESMPSASGTTVNQSHRAADFRTNAFTSQDSGSGLPSMDPLGTRGPVFPQYPQPTSIPPHSQYSQTNQPVPTTFAKSSANFYSQNVPPQISPTRSSSLSMMPETLKERIISTYRESQVSKPSSQQQTQF